MRVATVFAHQVLTSAVNGVDLLPARIELLDLIYKALGIRASHFALLMIDMINRLRYTLI